MNHASNDLVADPGSFRDSVNRVYSINGRILRGKNRAAGEIYRRLAREPFFVELLHQGAVIETRELDPASDSAALLVREEGWSHVLEHAPIPFVSYPYEWCFSMLREAALLQLKILEACLEHGWVLKDATPYNIQWRGARPMFIDTGSFEPWRSGEPWIGYRQFCSLFLVPLMLRAHLGIDYRPLLRSWLDGINPEEASKYFRGLSRFRPGVLSHVFLPAIVERGIARRERDGVPARPRTGGRHSKAMVLGLVQSLTRLVRRLEWKIQHTDWSHYDKTHSYAETDLAAKRDFVGRHLSRLRRRSVWDIGCNTGTFSKLAAAHADFVLAVDGDHDAIEQLYRSERTTPDSRILPLQVDLANISPDQGWAGRERRALDRRGRPDVILCLALIHHMRVSANVPIPLFLDWLRRLDCEVILEFVGRDDEMFQKLLANKTTNYEDYSIDRFVESATARFRIEDRTALKGGRRELFLLVPS